MGKGPGRRVPLGWGSVLASAPWSGSGWRACWGGRKGKWELKGGGGEDQLEKVSLPHTKPSGSVGQKLPSAQTMGLMAWDDGRCRLGHLHGSSMQGVVLLG